MGTHASLAGMATRFPHQVYARRLAAAAADGGDGTGGGSNGQENGSEDNIHHLAAERCQIRICRAHDNHLKAAFRDPSYPVWNGFGDGNMSAVPPSKIVSGRTGWSHGLRTATRRCRGLGQSMGVISSAADPKNV